VATATEAYAAATARSDSYRRTILPLAERNLELANKAFAGGEFDSLKVLQAQRAVGEARLEQVKALAERRQAAIDLAGWMLDDRWPFTDEKAP
jgi:cobalt-zinc-cadmium efflux system outer membrane protein